jgi:cell division protein ZapA|tara:strand:+ start:1692 stop:1976 length:285 start_codon:yes stop_codon:yes gene_type:complete
MEKLSIKIMIGNRAYSMKVPMEEEQKVRLAAKELNKKISEVGKKMNIQDLQDILAMISFELTIDANKSNYKIHENHKAQEKINTLIKLIDEKIN